MDIQKAIAPEEYFAKTFLRKERRDRLLSELTTPRKRSRGLDRFCHSSADLIDPERILMQGDDLERQPVFESFVKEHEEMVVLLSPEPTVDLLAMPFSEAVRIAVMSPDAVIIVGDGFSCVFSEVYKGRDKFLLIE